ERAFCYDATMIFSARLIAGDGAKTINRQGRKQFGASPSSACKRSDATMTIDCAFFGFCATDPEARTSQAGKQWTRLRVGVGKDNDVQWISVAAFGKAAATAAELKKLDRVYVEGAIKLDTWAGQDGAERHGLSVAAQHRPQPPE